MKKTKKVLVFAMCLVLLTAFAMPGNALAKKKVWRLGTANPGSYGYKIAGFLSDFLRKALPDYDVTVYPYASTTPNIKGFLLGDLESAYAAEPGLVKLYAFKKPFIGLESKVKQMPVQSFWSYTMETHILTLAKNKKISSKPGQISTARKSI